MRRNSATQELGLWFAQEVLGNKTPYKDGTIIRHLSEAKRVLSKGAKPDIIKAAIKDMIVDGVKPTSLTAPFLFKIPGSGVSYYERRLAREMTPQPWYDLYTKDKWNI